jgi:hypothetical protein
LAAGKEGTVGSPSSLPSIRLNEGIVGDLIDAETRGVVGDEGGLELGFLNGGGGGGIAFRSSSALLVIGSSSCMTLGIFFDLKGLSWFVAEVGASLLFLVTSWMETRRSHSRNVQEDGGCL